MTEAYKNLIKKAEIAARLGDDRTSVKSMYGHHEKASLLYEKAGDVSKESRVKLKSYKNALDYSWESDNKKRISKKINKLEFGLGRFRIFALAAIVSFVFSLVFISFNLTGFSMINIPVYNNNWVSIPFFILGLVFTLFYFKEKARKN